MCYVVQGGAPERIEVHVGCGLADRQLARRRPAGERGGGLTRLGGDEGAEMRHARTALARARSAQRGTLDQLEVLEALVPHHLQIVDRDLRTRAHDPGVGAGWQFELLLRPGLRRAHGDR